MSTLPRAFRNARRRSATVAAGIATGGSKYVPTHLVPRPYLHLAAQFPPMAEDPGPGVPKGEDLRGRVRREGRRLQVWMYHTAIAIGSDAGYPDITAGQIGGIIWRELKGSDGRLTVVQLDRINAIRASGGDANIWWPEDWYLGHITRELEALTRPRAGIVTFPPLGVLAGTHPARDPSKIWCKCGCEYGAAHTCETWGGR